jgi:hypothetical protein
LNLPGQRKLSQWKDEDIYPLVSSQLEDIDIPVPSALKHLLQKEYGKKVPTNNRFHWQVYHKRDGQKPFTDKSEGTILIAYPKPGFLNDGAR